MKKIIILIAIILATPACVALSGNQTATSDEQLNAENRLMKNNLKLAMRENEILKAENHQYRTEATRLNAQIRRISGEIDALNRKYDNDMAQMTERYNKICDEYAKLEKSSGDKIQELTDLNKELDKRMKDEVSRLNAAMAYQKADFEKRRKTLKANFAGKEKGYAARLSALKASLKEKKAALASMKPMYDEALLQIENLQKKVDQLKATIDDLSRKNTSLTGSDTDMQIEDKDKQKSATGTGKGPQPAVPAPTGSPADSGASPQAP